MQCFQGAWDFFKSSGVVRHRDVEMTFRKEEVLYLQILINGKHMIPHRATREGTSVSQEAEGAKGEKRTRAFLVVSM